MKLHIIILIAFLIFGSAQRSVSQWIQSEGSLTQEGIMSIAVSGSNLLAGTDAYGFFLSTDNGENWKAVSRDNVRVVAASGADLIASSDENIFLSIDNGKSWLITHTNIPPIRSFTFGGTNIFAGTESGIYLSGDKGRSWKPLNGSLASRSINTLAVLDTDIYASTDSGIYLSSDNGNDWIPLGLQNNYILTIAISGTTLFAGTENGFFRSTDNGTSWKEMSQGSIQGVVLSLVVLGTNLFAGTNISGVYHSTDNGTTWKQVFANYTPIRALAVSGTYIFSGTSNGLYLSSDNGLTWGQGNSLPLSGIIHVLGTSKTNLFTYETGIYRSTNGGTIWTQSDFSNLLVTGFASLGENFYVSTNGGVFLTTNNAKNWTRTNFTSNTLSLTVSGTDLFAGTNDSGIYRSTDYGTSWAQLGLTNHIIYAIAASGTDIFAGTDSSAFLSSDNGGSWSRLFIGTTSPVRTFTFFGEMIFATTQEAIFLSNDNGKSWTDMIFSPYDACLMAVGTNLFAGSNSGVFLSTDRGISWYTVNTGLPTNVNVTAFTVFGNNLYAGTLGHSVWRRPLSEMISIDEVKTPMKAVGVFSLGQNVPNPATESTTISFYLEKNAFVTLKILDMLGREVSTIAEEELPPGNYSRSWNAAGFPSGEYFYRLQTGNQSQTKSLVLLK